MTKSAQIFTLFALLLAPTVHPADVAIDDFERGVTDWGPGMTYGDVSGCDVRAGDGRDGGRALRVDYEFKAPATNHIVYSTEVALDLSWSEGVRFDIRGMGDRVMLFLFVWDSQDRFSNYGPHGTNRDFHTGHTDWHRCIVSFDDDRSVQGGGADLADINRIGFMLNNDGPRQGTVWIDNLAAIDTAASIDVAPATFSPNADGVYDTARIRLFAPRDVAVTLRVFDEHGKAVAKLAENMPAERRRIELQWDGTGADGTCPDGTYTLRADFSNEHTAADEEHVTIDTTHNWPPIDYDVEPFFPIGVWFEGAPGAADYPSDPAGARRYYDRCFADLANNGFNAVAVPNCPAQLWEPLLRSARDKGIKVVLEVGPLVSLVSSDRLVTEAEVYDAVKRVVDKIGGYESLLRYQVRDEPAPEMMPNWLLVQRILAATDPARPAFSCFCHPESLDAATDASVLSEAVFDIYPHHLGTPEQTLGGFMGLLERFKRAAKGAPPWMVLQAFATPGRWRYPTAEELRAVTYLSLAAGAKGVFYFIYQTMPKHSGKLQGLTNPDGTPRPIYAPAKALAADLNELAPLLLSARPVDGPPHASDDVVVGRFRTADADPMLVIAGARPDAPVTARLTALKPDKWRDVLSGQLFRTHNGTLSVPLSKGAGRVLVAE